MSGIMDFVMVFLLIAVAVTLTAWIVRKGEEKRQEEFQNLVLNRQREEVQSIYQTMRGWRHDYHNHMQSIKACLSMNQVEEAISYLDHLEADLDSIDFSVRTGNVGLDAILSSKISIAMKHDISVNFKANVPEKLQVSDVHLCALVGNLLDNAVEACDSVDKEKRFIRIYIGIFRKQLYISVSNASSFTERKKTTELVSSKQGNHGLGLRRINRIVEEYHGYVNRNNEPGVFVTEIMLPL